MHVDKLMRVGKYMLCVVAGATSTPEPPPAALEPPPLPASLPGPQTLERRRPSRAGAEARPAAS